MDFKNKKEERKLIKSCVRNNRRAQEKFYRHFYPVMMRLCMRYTEDRNLAMEIVNDGMLKVFKKLEMYKDKGSLEGWIRRIVFHALSDHFRKKSSKVKFLEIEEKKTLLPDVVMNNLYYDDLMVLVHALPASSRKVFMLYAIEGFNHREIGVKLNISDGTSKWHLSNARKQLKEQINKRNQEVNHV